MERGTSTDRTMIKEISNEDLKQRIADGEKIVVLDVRRPDEHAEKHIDGSILIPLHELEERIDELMPYKDSEIVVYCRSGNRSAQACMFLGMVGFEQAVNLRGGMLTW